MQRFQSTPPAWADHSSASPSCYRNGPSCHGHDPSHADALTRASTSCPTNDAQEACATSSAVEVCDQGLPSAAELAYPQPRAHTCSTPLGTYAALRVSIYKSCGTCTPGNAVTSRAPAGHHRSACEHRRHPQSVESTHDQTYMRV